MNIQQKASTQLPGLNKRLKDLKPYILPEDRKVAHKKYSHVTVIQYLAGKGKEINTAIALIRIFEKCILKRDEKVRRISNSKLKRA